MHTPDTGLRRKQATADMCVNAMTEDPSLRLEATDAPCQILLSM